MFLMSLSRAYSLLIPNNNTQIIQLLRISTNIKYFSNSYVTCTSSKNDIYDISRKRKFNELGEEFKELNEFIKFTLNEINEYKDEELMSLQNKKNNKTEDSLSSSCLFQELEIYSENYLESNQQEDLYLSVSSSLLPEPELHSQISPKSNQPVQISINNNEENLNDICLNILIFLDKNNSKIFTHKIFNIFYTEFVDMIEYYELHKNKINEKEFISKIEEIFKKIIERSFQLNDYGKEKYTKLINKIYESSSKYLKNEDERDKAKILYKLLLDINFIDIISKNKKKVIENFKNIKFETEDLKKLEENVKKIFDDNKKYFVRTHFFKFLHNFFNKKEYFLLRLLKGSYKTGYNPYKFFLEDDILKIGDIMEIIKYYKNDKLFFVFRNVSNKCSNIILERLCEEDNKKFEIFTIYVNYIHHKQHTYYIKYVNEMHYKPHLNYIDDMKYMKSDKFSINYNNIIRELKDNFIYSN